MASKAQWKKRACEVLAKYLEFEVEQILSCEMDPDARGGDQADGDRMTAAVHELVDEMYRRSRGADEAVYPEPKEALVSEQQRRMSEGHTRACAYTIHWSTGWECTCDREELQ